MFVANRNKQINTCRKLMERHPNKYCWADLAMMAMSTDSEMRFDYKERAKEVNLCKEYADKNGRCFCGYYTSGGVE